MPIYHLEIKTVVVVQADDAEQARDVALMNRFDAMLSDIDPSIEMLGQVETLADLRDDWTGTCLPYGGDGDARLMDLLPNAQQSAA